jgi:DNA-binding MurR/RpiR family transcriptional regulator
MSILQQDIDNLHETISLIDPHAWATAVQMIARAHRIFVVSFDNGASLAQILANGLLRIKTDVHCIANGGGGFNGVRHIVNMTAPDLVIAIAFPRYIKDTIRLATLAKDKGLPVLGITDTHRSPLASVCNTNLYVSVKRQFASVSNAAVLSLVEALLGSVLHSTPEAVERAQLFTEDALPWMENP